MFLSYITSNFSPMLVYILSLIVLKIEFLSWGWEGPKIRGSLFLLVLPEGWIIFLCDALCLCSRNTTGLSQTCFIPRGLVFASTKDGNTQNQLPSSPVARSPSSESELRVQTPHFAAPRCQLLHLKDLFGFNSCLPFLDFPFLPRFLLSSRIQAPQQTFCFVCFAAGEPEAKHQFLHLQSGHQ